jgi:hypothetical protein
MKPNPPAALADLVLLFIAVAWLAAEALAAVLIAPLALVSPSSGKGRSSLCDRLEQASISQA